MIGGICLGSLALGVLPSVILAIGASIVAAITAFAAACWSVTLSPSSVNWRRDAISVALRSSLVVAVVGGAIAAGLAWGRGATLPGRLSLMITLGLIAPVVLGTGYLAGVGATMVPILRTQGGADHELPPLDEVPSRGFLPWALLGAAALLVVALYLPTRPRPSTIAPDPPAARIARKPEKSEDAKRSFSFAPSPLMQTSDPGDLVVESIETIRDIDPRQTMLLDPSGQSLAYCSRADGVLVVLDLHSLVEMARLSDVKRPHFISWSPSEKRIACFWGNSERRFAIVDVAKRSTIWVDVPDGTRVDARGAWWYHDNEIGLMRPDGEAQFLELEFLRTGPRSESPHWKDDNPNNIESLARPGHLPHAERFQFEIAAVPERYVRGREGMISYEEKVLRLAVANTDRTHRYLLELPPLDSRSELMLARDLSKVVVVSDPCAVVYLGVEIGRNAPVIVETERFKFAEERMQTLSTIAGEGRLGAHITAPMVNPLNGRIISPDRDRVKARAVCVEWSPEGARFQVADPYQTVATGDVIGDLCVFNRDGDAVLVDAEVELDHPGAFAVVRKVIDAGDYLAADGGLISGKHIQVDLAGSAYSIGNEIVAQPKLAPKPVRDPDSAQAASPARSRPSSASPSPAASHAPIVEFIQAHHRKATGADLDGYVNDYIEGAQYFDVVGASREKIREIQQNYYEKWSEVRETVVSPIAVERMAGNPERYEVKYRIEFHLESEVESRRIETRDGTVDVEMEIVRTASGKLGISRQTGVVANTVAGERKTD